MAPSIRFFVCAVLLAVQTRLLNATEWVKLPDMASTGDSLNMHSDMLMDRYVATTTPPDPENQSVAPIKYEDLVHIVGPGFEDELERYYKLHKHELDESTRRSTKPSTIKPNRVYYIPEDDPWSVYDQPSVPLNRLQHSQGNLSSYSDSIGKPSGVHFISKPSHTGSNKNHQPSVPVKPLPEESVENPKQSDVTDMPIKNETPTKTAKRKQYKLVRVQARPQPSTTTTSMLGISNIFGFLRNIQNSFVTNTSRSIQDKIKMLETFRDDMLGNIKRRISALWPTKTVRTKRGVLESHDSGHGMDFPSSEGALMTLSFLTFAVFLIKLVLQVIHTIKSKHYSYNSFDTYNTSGSVAVIKENRNARSIRDEAGEYPLDDDPLLAGSRLSVDQILRSLPKNHQFY